MDVTNGSVTARITGEGAGKAFEKESGKHVCQRVPPTETKGRRHTSVISVAVLSIPKKVASISESEVSYQPVNLGGKGGQHQNRTLSGCRATHLPTKTVVTINGRSYHANQKLALKILSEKVRSFKQEAQNEKHSRNRKSQIQGGHRSGKVRTYNFIKSQVTDHQTKKKVNLKQVIGKGKFDLLHE